MSRLIWEALIALALITNPAARQLLRDAANAARVAAITAWQAARGIVATIWPGIRRVVLWTARIGILAIVITVLGIWIPALHIVAAVMLAIWLILLIQALNIIAAAVGAVNITVPGTSITISGQGLANALSATGKPIALLGMVLGAWIMQIVVFPGMLAFAGLLILGAIILWTFYASLTGRGYRWLVRVLILFFWISVIGFIIQGIARHTELGSALDENRRENVQWVTNLVKHGSVTRHKENRAQEAQTEFERLEAYPFRASLWTSNPVRKGMDIPLFDGHGNAVPDPTMALQILHARGSWHPTEERVPRKVSSQIAAPMVAIEAPDDRTVKFIVPVETLLGYRKGGAKSDLEAARTRTGRAVEKKSIYGEAAKAPVIEKLNRVRVKASSIAPYWFADTTAGYVKAAVVAGRIAKVHNRTAELPDDPVVLPSATLPASLNFDEPSYFIEFLDTGEKGWLPAEFAEWIENPLVGTTTGGRSSSSTAPVSREDVVVLGPVGLGPWTVQVGAQTDPVQELAGLTVPPVGRDLTFTVRYPDGRIPGTLRYEVFGKTTAAVGGWRLLSSGTLPPRWNSTLVGDASSAGLPLGIRVYR